MCRMIIIDTSQIAIAFWSESIFLSISSDFLKPFIILFYKIMQIFNVNIYHFTKVGYPFSTKISVLYNIFVISLYRTLPNEVFKEEYNFPMCQKHEILIASSS